MDRMASYLSLLLVLFLVPYPKSEAAAPLAQYCSNDKPTTAPVSKSIARVLSSIVSNAPSKRFYATSSGAGAAKVFGLVQCRQDVSAADCRACVNDAAAQLPKLCPNQADGRIWFDFCFLRYDTRDFTGQLDTGYGVFYISTVNISESAAEQQRFNRVLGTLMGKVQKQASGKGSLGLARQQTKFTPFVTLYAMAQCTRDLSPLSCAQCVSTATANFPAFCPFRNGCRALYSSCYVRYEIYPFFFPLAAGAAAAQSSSFPFVVSP